MTPTLSKLLGVAVVFCVVLGVASAVGNVYLGNYVIAFSSAMWALLVVLNLREYLKWRSGEHPWSTKRWIEEEERARAKFAKDLLLLKAQVASQMTDNVEKLGLLGEPATLDLLRTLYLDVADTWIPEDAPSDLHELKRRAQVVADTGEWRTLH